MLSKIALLFLVAMVVLAVFGRLRFPGAIGRRLRDRKPALRPGKCPRCGRYLIGTAGCDCTKPQEGR